MGVSWGKIQLSYVNFLSKFAKLIISISLVSEIVNEIKKCLRGKVVLALFWNQRAKAPPYELPPPPCRRTVRTVSTLKCNFTLFFSLHSGCLKYRRRIYNYIVLMPTFTIKAPAGDWQPNCTSSHSNRQKEAETESNKESNW